MAKDLHQMNDAERMHHLATHKYLKVGVGQMGYYSKETLARNISQLEDRIQELRVRLAEEESKRDRYRTLLKDFDHLPSDIAHD